jgi:hypothetical protein
MLTRISAAVAILLWTTSVNAQHSKSDPRPWTRWQRITPCHDGRLHQGRERSWCRTRNPRGDRTGNCVAASAVQISNMVVWSILSAESEIHGQSSEGTADKGLTRMRRNSAGAYQHKQRHILFCSYSRDSSFGSVPPEATAATSHIPTVVLHYVTECKQCRWCVQSGLLPHPERAAGPRSEIGGFTAVRVG